MPGTYPLYLARYLGMQRDHHAIFIDTGETIDIHGQVEKAGQKFQVTGNIQTGMEYENRLAEDPDVAEGTLGKSLIGHVDKEDYDRVDEICRDLSAPKKQFDGPRRLYPEEPLYRCQEWTADAIQALRDTQVLKA